MPFNYTFQDIFGSLYAVLLFTLIFVFPGYVIGWWLNLFEFRKRLTGVKLIIGVTLSNAFSPILVFLIYRFTSSSVVIVLLLVVFFIWAILHFRGRQKIDAKFVYSLETAKYQKLAFFSVIAWVIFSILMLMEVQIGERLYFSTNSYDMITRVAMVDAITRTGVPPLNPSYYPGHPVPLNFLYYFWYILGSIVDQVGGPWVSAYQAMIASISWCGIAIASTMATYMRLRNSNSRINSWLNSIHALKFLAVGGLDFIIVMIIMAIVKARLGYLPFEGRVEGWNMPIMSWLNAVMWVPHHVSAALACMTALMIFVYHASSVRSRKLMAAVLIGLAFASAFGLSVWGMFVFAVFWAVWMIVIYFQNQGRELVLWMALGGISGMIFVSPFIAGLFQAGASSYSGGGIPVAFYVRPFIFSAFLTFLPRIAFYAINFLMLPLNYLFEFGFFFIVALLWIGSRFREKIAGQNRYYVPELILVAVVTILMSFLYSDIISINDLGIRGWLPVQFILIVWAADVVGKDSRYKNALAPKVSGTTRSTTMLSAVINAALVVGLLTTLLEGIALRMWPMMIDASIVGFPNELSADTYLGERTYFGRLAYDYLRDNIPAGVITQSNPFVFLDHSSGVYGTHQMVVASRTSYGIPPAAFNKLVEDVGVIFTDTNDSNWRSIDSLCRQYLIDVLIISDTDPIWNSISLLEEQRIPLYKNGYYAVFSCGNYIER
ncbi:MAG: hypothetical protein IPO22_15020 [Anaerolineales bacterium]|nr:hypothetical protein [Anaerolineales bacterium]